MRPHTVKSIALAAAVATILGASLPAWAQDAKDLTLGQAGTPQSEALKVTVTADRPDMTYAIGEAARLTIRTNRSAYVTVFDVGPAGEATQLFPNRYQPGNLVKADVPVEIGDGRTARVTVSGPVGDETLKVVASNKPLTVLKARLVGDGPFLVVEGGAGALARSLDMAAKADPEAARDIIITDVTLKTVASRPTAQVAAPVVVLATPSSQGAEGAVVMPMLPSAHAFPLLIAADKQSYAVGEEVTLAVTPTKDCHLMVLEIPSAGVPRILFPNAVLKDDAVKGMATVFVAGGSAPVTLKAAGPAGPETVMAICTTDAAPVFVAETSTGERASVARNLSLAAARPKETVATASTSFSITP